MVAHAPRADLPPWPRSRMSVIVWAMAPTLTFGPCVSLEVKHTYKRGKPVDFPWITTTVPPTRYSGKPHEFEYSELMFDGEITFFRLSLPLSAGASVNSLQAACGSC